MNTPDDRTDLRGSLSCRVYRQLRLLAKSFDAELDRLAGIEKHRRLHSEPDAGRGAGRDDVARLQAHELRDIVDEERDAEDHGPGRAVLAHDAVDREPHLQILRIGDFIAGNQPWPDRTKAVGRFSFRPLTSAFRLELAFRHVVD